MTTYAVGDVQGCYDELQALLDKIKFDFRRDTLWLTGDLVNRGPRSLEVLRFIKSLGECAVTVLGNHDLHLLAVAYGHQPAKQDDTIEAILSASDKDELLHWLRTRPLLFHDEIRNLTLIHAGLAPQWSLSEAITPAQEVEKILSGNNFHELLSNMYGNLPDKWDPELTGMDRLRFIINCFTRLRFVDQNNQLRLKAKGTPDSQSEAITPWFNVSNIVTTNSAVNNKILFGHWSTLGFTVADNAVCLDSGCVWGGKLTAINVDDIIASSVVNVEPINVACPELRKPRQP